MKANNSMIPDGQVTEADLSHIIPEHSSMDIFMEPLEHIGDADMNQSSATNDGISEPIELDGESMDEEDCSFMFECFEDEVLDLLSLEDVQPDYQESLRTKHRENGMSKKKLVRNEKKKKRKPVPLRKRRYSSPASG